MGLDQYGYFVKNRQEIDDKHNEFSKLISEGKTYAQIPSVENFYWRKHPNLEGWMRNLYREKGGLEEFNCEYLELTLEDIEDLEKSLQATHQDKIANSKDFITEVKKEINAEPLPETTGFFFGENSDDEYAEQDFKFVEEAKEAIKQGLKVFYFSSW